MDSALEKNANEIEALQREIQSHARYLDEYRQQLQGKQSLLKELQKEHHDLGMKMQKIMEQCEKTNKDIIQQTEFVQNAERNLSSSQQQLLQKENTYKQRIIMIEQEKKAKEAFEKSPEGMAYQEFLRRYPQHINKDRSFNIDWAYYLTGRAQQFENEWKEYLKANNNGSEYCFHTGPGLLRTFITFPGFPQIHVGPHESDGSNKVNDGRNNFHRCYQWFENNKKLLENYKASQKAEAEKRQQEIDKAKVEWQKKNEEEEKKSAMFREAVIKLFLEKVGNTMTSEEADAILGKFHEPQNTHYAQVLRGHHIDTSTNVYLWKNVFKQDSLLAMKVCNRFAQQNEIRVEDAMALFKEYAAIQYTLPNENKNTNTRSYIRDVNC
jgi:hypothetical protein